MHGRGLGAVALVVGLSVLPLQTSTTYADSCEIVGSNGSMIIEDGSGPKRSWRLHIDGVTYQSDEFDSLKKTKSSSKNGSKKETLFTFKDSKNVDRTPNNDVTKSINAKVKGEINESSDRGFVTVKDKTNKREYRIEDPEHGLAINCG
jgi:hypothetical protein